MTLREVAPYADARLRCGIGHTYPGRVRRVQHQGHDMDGDAFWHPETNDYDPPRCVVCGLVTWAVVEASAPNEQGAE